MRNIFLIHPCMRPSERIKIFFNWYEGNQGNQGLLIKTTHFASWKWPYTAGGLLREFCVSCLCPCCIFLFAVSLSPWQMNDSRAISGPLQCRSPCLQEGWKPLKADEVVVYRRGLQFLLIWVDEILFNHRKMGWEGWQWEGRWHNDRHLRCGLFCILRCPSTPDLVDSQLWNFISLFFVI